MEKPWVWNLCRLPSNDPSWCDEDIHEHKEVATLYKKYPKSIDTCLRNSYFEVTQRLAIHGFIYTLDSCSCFMTVSTPRKEAHMIRKAKQLLHLLAENIPIRKVYQIFNGKECDVIKIWYQEGGFSKEAGISEEQFTHRRDLLFNSLKALERLTSTEVFIRPKTVVVIGDTSEGVKMVRDVVRDCIVSNVSPAAKIKSMERVLIRKDIESVRRRLHNLRYQ